MTKAASYGSTAKAGGRLGDRPDKGPKFRAVCYLNDDGYSVAAMDDHPGKREKLARKMGKPETSLPRCCFAVGHQAHISQSGCPKTKDGVGGD